MKHYFSPHRQHCARCGSYCYTFRYVLWYACLCIYHTVEPCKKIKIIAIPYGAERIVLDLVHITHWGWSHSNFAQIFGIWQL